jgi:hypothetical protein
MKIIQSLPSVEMLPSSLHDWLHQQKYCCAVHTEIEGTEALNVEWLLFNNNHNDDISIITPTPGQMLVTVDSRQAATMHGAMHNTT